MKQTYRPLGARVILKVLPKEIESSIVMPDGKTNPREKQYFQVVAVGGEVNDDKFQLNIGDIVLTACHPTEIIGLDQDEQLILVERNRIMVVVEKGPGNN